MRFPKSPLFYGWYVLGSSFLILFFVQGTRSVFGVLFKPIISELGWSRGAVSLATFVNMAVFALTLTLVGRFYDRFGARKVLFIATLFLAVGHLGIALVTRYWQFLILNGVVVAIGLGGASVPLFGVLTVKWFYRHRGLAISIALTGGCLGQYILVPVATYLVATLDWRWTFFIIGLSLLIVNLLIIYIVIKDDPSELGLTALGAPALASPNNRLSPAPSDRESDRKSDLNIGGAMRTTPFWLFLAVMFICGGGDYMVLLHLVPMVTDQGIPADTAASMLAWFGLLSLAGVLATGRAIDVIGNKIPMVLTFILRSLLFFYILKSQSVTAFYIFSLGFGFTMMVTAPITTTLMGRLYGLTHLGLISGVITTVHHLGGGLWAYLGGVIFDRCGDYRLVLGLYGGCCLVATVCALLIRTRPISSQRVAG
ncbi:MAG: MFS transporter [Pseudomonadota bacterium]